MMINQTPLPLKPPPPICPHCRERFRDLLKLDQHLRFDCPALGRDEHDACDFDYKTITLNAGTYCRTHDCYHFGV